MYKSYGKQQLGKYVFAGSPAEAGVVVSVSVYLGFFFKLDGRENGVYAGM